MLVPFFEFGGIYLAVLEERSQKKFVSFAIAIVHRNIIQLMSFVLGVQELSSETIFVLLRRFQQACFSPLDHVFL